jgi:SAM-dependent methyltransferase
VVHATERMYGNGGDFRYANCPTCECMYLLNVPANLLELYPTDYYSFSLRPVPDLFGLKLALKRVLCHHYYQRLNPFLVPAGLFYKRHVDWLPRGSVAFDEPILDIGCGAGTTLDLLGYEGFENLTGIDPFVAGDVTTERFRILKQDLSEHEGRYKLIYSSHVIEHVTDPAEFLSDVDRLLAPDGLSLIRTPNPVSFAARYYKQFWFGLDPPRHINLLSPKTFTQLAAQAGLRVERFRPDSGVLQFTGSENYLKGRTLEELQPVMGAKRTFLVLLAGVLNAMNYGDSSSFLLRKA